MEDIAKNADAGLVHTKDIAGRNGISLKYLEQILAVLSKGGYVRSVKGKMKATVYQENHLNTPSEIFFV